MSVLSRSLVALVTGAVLLLVASGAAASKKQAQKHFKAGTELMKVEDFTGAMAEFEQSVELYPTKNGLFNLGNCYKALHRYGDALDTFERLEREFGKKLSGEMQGALERNLEEIRTLIAHLTIQVNLEGAAVFVDDQEVGRSPLARAQILGPGPHTVKVELSGFDTQIRTVRLVSGDRKIEAFKLERAASFLTVTANVSGATVSVDGSEKGKTPLAEPIAVGSGEHYVRLAREGYQETERRISLQSGEKLTVDFTLVPLVASDGGAAEPVTEPVTEPDVEVEAPGKRKPSALFWVGFSLTLASGAVAGGMWAAADSSYRKFQKDGKTYEETQNDYPYPAEEVQAQYQDLLDLRDEVNRRGKLAVGFGIGAGALALVSGIILAVDLAGGDEETAAVALLPAPNGLALSF